MSGALRLQALLGFGGRKGKGPFILHSALTVWIELTPFERVPLKMKVASWVQISHSQRYIMVTLASFEALLGNLKILVRY
jgi:hypothetical protein